MTGIIAAALTAILVGCAAPRNVVRHDVDCSDPDQARSVPLVRVNPYYPPQAYRKRIAGWVHVRFSIGPDGEVVDPQVVESDPPGIFDAEVIETVRQWRYCPPGGVVRYPDPVETRLRFER